MRQGPDEPRGGTARQLGIGVERDHEADLGWHLARLDQERGVGRAAQQAIELVQLAALALPAHPAPLAVAPETPAVEEIEARLAVARRAMPAVELGDAGARRLQQGLVLRRVLRGGVGPVRDEAEAQLSVVV